MDTYPEIYRVVCEGCIKNESLWWLWELLHSSWLEMVLEWFKDRILQMRLLLVQIWHWWWRSPLRGQHDNDCNSWFYSSNLCLSSWVHSSLLMISWIFPNLHLSAYRILVENYLRTPLSDSAFTYINMSTLPPKCPLDYLPISSSLMLSKVFLVNPFVSISASCSFDSTFKTLIFSGLRHTLN